MVVYRLRVGILADVAEVVDDETIVRRAARDVCLGGEIRLGRVAAGEVEAEADLRRPVVPLGSWRPG